MPYLQLKLVSERAIGQETSCRFTHQGGSIGRSNSCDWSLLDDDRYVSNKHLLISFKNQQFVLIDVSSNGVFINNATAALGKNNEHILQLSDSIKIGKFCIKVENIAVQDNVSDLSEPSNASEDSGLMGLVMGGDAKPSSNETLESLLKTPENMQYSTSQQTDDGLGLSEILSDPANPPATNSCSISTEQSSPFDASSNEPQPFTKPQEPYATPAANQHHVANDTSIPEDWELSGIMPAVSDYKAPNDRDDTNEVTPPAQVEVAPQLAKKVDMPSESFVSESIQTSESQEIKSFISEPEPEVSSVPQVSAGSSNEVEKKQPTVATSDAQIKKNEDVFLKTLYNKLGLPKEYFSTINPDLFADDIATILLSTTKGLMSLLNSRTAFKQESRLSLTSVQPRSNNPIKFSIDPVDTLEMLLLKKKKGYLSTKDSYEEALDDIQLHQMAFLSGLQATLTGVLGQLEPESIEAQVNESGRSFMGLNSGTKCWQLYKEKQQLMAKTVTENLNEVLSNYFSEAYQAQINSFKNEK